MCIPISSSLAVDFRKYIVRNVASGVMGNLNPRIQETFDDRKVKEAIAMQISSL